MKRFQRTTFALTGLLCSGSLSVVFAQKPVAPPPVKKEALPIKLTVTTDKKLYKPNEPIKIVLKATNTTKKPVALHFASGQKYDFVLSKTNTDKDGLVWRWSEGRMFTEMLQTVTVAPGKPLLLKETFTITKPMEKGTYRLQGGLKTMGEAVSSDVSTKITVR